MKKLPKSQRPRWRRIIRRALVVFASALVLMVVGFVVWANVGVMGAEPDRLNQVMTDSAVTVTDTADSIVMTPTGEASGTGLVFIPGAKVDAKAYLYKLSGIVADYGVTVIVTKPILNLAFFDQRPLSTFTDHAKSVTNWYVGGHSLGGVRACQYAAQPDVAGLVLFGSYCANDLSASGIEALSLTGSDDGLSTPEKVAASAKLLPAHATEFEIQGANHASFGDYGVQPGDGAATLSSGEMQSIVTEQLARLFG